jgi:hypothetical protein
MSGAHGYCAKCEKHDYLLPLHGERGGPRCCLLRIGKWDAEHIPRQRARRNLIRAMTAYAAACGSVYSADFDKIRLATGGFGRDDDAADEFKDLTRELLTAPLALTHPDRHPPERLTEALRVTQELTALQPFVFPAPAPAPPPKKRKRTREPEPIDDLRKLTSMTDYPCVICDDTVPGYYCDACRAEYEKRTKQEDERRTAQQRAQYARGRKRVLAKRAPAVCPMCLKGFARKRGDARYCSDRCRQQAHRKAPVTDRQCSPPATSTNRDPWRRAILALLDRHKAVYLNDLLPESRTRAQYQQLCRVVDGLEAAGEIETWRFLSRIDVGHKALTKPGHTIKHRNVKLLKDSERLQTTARQFAEAAE